MKSFIAILISFLFASFISASDNTEGKSYIPLEQPLPLIGDINREAVAWATCAAAYRIKSKIVESSAEPNEYKNTANGAELAVFMTFLKPLVLEDSPDPLQFRTRMEYAKTLMKSMPNAQLAEIMADYEKQEINDWVANLKATLSHCSDNLEYQQAYIETYRNIMMRGLMKYRE